MRNVFFTSVRVALASTAMLAGFSATSAVSSEGETRSLREQLEQLDQKLRVLERRQQIRDEDAAAALKTAARVTVNDRGVNLASADGAHVLRLRAVIQADSRAFFGHDGSANNETFLLRKLRPILEGTFSRFVDFQITPDFGGSSFQLLDASATVRLAPEAQLKFGKFKTPLGFEQLVSDPWLIFAERSVATNLVPNRDVGIQLGGDLLGGRIAYQAGLFNGVADGGNSTNADFDNHKDVAVRLFARPFSHDRDSLLQGLGVGLAGTAGHQETASALTSGYRTDGQQTFFRYRANVVSDGAVWRISPQVYFYRGPFGVFAEYVKSVVNVRPAATTGPKTELAHRAWEISASYVLTGEDASYTAGVVPKKPFDLAARTWGAVELVARVGSLDIDDNAFPLVADPLANATRITSFGLGANWYLTRTLKATADFFQTDFKLTGGTSTASILRQDEKVLITRVQVAF